MYIFLFGNVSQPNLFIKSNVNGENRNLDHEISYTDAKY